MRLHGNALPSPAASNIQGFVIGIYGNFIYEKVQISNQTMSKNDKWGGKIQKKT